AATAESSIGPASSEPSSRIRRYSTFEMRSADSASCALRSTSVSLVMASPNATRVCWSCRTAIAATPASRSTAIASPKMMRLLTVQFTVSPHSRQEAACMSSVGIDQRLCVQDQHGVARYTAQQRGGVLVAPRQRPDLRDRQLAHVVDCIDQDTEGGLLTGRERKHALAVGDAFVRTTERTAEVEDTQEVAAPWRQADHGRPR